MSNFSTAGIDTESTSTGNRVSQYIQFGIQNFMINSIEVKTSPNGNKQCILSVETHKVVTEGFEPHVDSKNGGQVGRVSFPPFYLTGKTMNERVGNETVQETDYNLVMRRVGIIADKLGVRSKVDAVTADNFDDYINQVTPIISGKYAWWKIKGEEYLKADGKKGVKLGLAWYGFIASEEEGAEKLKFDKNNTYDFKAVGTPDTTVSSNGTTPTEALPF